MARFMKTCINTLLVNYLEMLLLASSRTYNFEN